MQNPQNNRPEEWVNVLSKGIITIPKKIREQVGLKEGDVARVKTQGNKVIIEPREEKPYRTFTKEEIERWAKEDELTPETLKMIDELWPELP